MNGTHATGFLVLPAGSTRGGVVLSVPPSITTRLLGTGILRLPATHETRVM